ERAGDWLGVRGRGAAAARAARALPAGGVPFLRLVLDARRPDAGHARLAPAGAARRRRAAALAGGVRALHGGVAGVASGRPRSALVCGGCGAQGAPRPAIRNGGRAPSEEGLRAEGSGLREQKRQGAFFFYLFLLALSPQPYLSIASRRALNSEPDFHSGKPDLSAAAKLAS